MKVLLVDDEERFVSALAKRLRIRGVDADYVLSGEGALRRAAETSYDVAVLDMRMPGISGIEVRRALEEIDERLRFIFLTGHGSDADFQVGSGEAAFYLAKPLQVEELMEAIHRTMEDDDGIGGGES